MDVMIEDVAGSVKKYSEKYRKQVAIVFDEFQQIGIFSTDRIEKKLRSIVQTHGRKISYIFMGSKKHLIYDMFSNPSRPFYKIGRHLPLGKIPAEELTPFVIERFKTSGLKISKEMAGKIVDMAECHPYYVQHLGSSVWKLAKEEVNEQTIEKALTLTLAEEKSAYTNIWDELSLNQRKTLKMIAELKQEKKIYSVDSLQKFNLAATAVQKSIKSLIMKELIDKSNGSYEINDVFLNHWLMRI